MGRPKLLVMSRAVLQLARPPADEFDLLVLDDAEDREAWLRAHGAGIEAVLSSGMERFGADRFALLPDLKLISVIAAGVAGIDLDTARDRGIAVTNGGDINADDVAEFAVTLMLAHRRDLLACDAYVRADRWTGGRMPPGRSVASQRVGIVGLGHIGRAVADRLAPFKCEIGWWGPRPKPDAPWPRHESLVDLARWATTLVVCVVGDKATRGLVTGDVIDALGPDGLIVNVSRGFVIDQAAMIAALRDGRLGGAALDVFDPEPTRAETWAGVPNLLLAPHMAGATEEAIGAIAALAMANIRRHFAGEALRYRVV